MNEIASQPNSLLYVDNSPRPTIICNSGMVQTPHTIDSTVVALSLRLRAKIRVAGLDLRFLWRTSNRFHAACRYLPTLTTDVSAWLLPCHAGLSTDNVSAVGCTRLFGAWVQVYVPRIQPRPDRVAAEGVRLVQFQRYPDHRRGKAPDVLRAALTLQVSVFLARCLRAIGTAGRNPLRSSRYPRAYIQWAVE